MRPKAMIIMDQMGGINKVTAMTGAFNFMKTDNSMQFKFKGSKTFNCVKIELNSMDLYDVTFYKLGKYDIKKQKGVNGIYNDQLKKVFESNTELYLSL